MRLNPLVLAPRQSNARAPQVEPVPFKMLLPMQLRKTVSGKGDTTRESFCMQEMALMFSCLKTAEFDQKKCGNEISKFQNCYTKHYEAYNKQQEQAKKGLLVPGEKKLTRRQANKLLKAFPPKNNIF